MNLIPKMYNPNEDEMIEHENYVSLYKFKNEIRESGGTIAELKQEEIEQMMYFSSPTTGELQIASDGLQVTNIEIFDITGKTGFSHCLTISSKN